MSNKRKSLEPVSASTAVPAEEQRKRAKLWREEQLKVEHSVSNVSSSGSKVEVRSNYPDSLSRKSAKRTSADTADHSPKKRTKAAARKSLAPELLVRGRPSPSPPRDRRAATGIQEQKQKAKLWREKNLSSQKTVLSPQNVYDENEIPDSLKPSRVSDGPKKQIIFPKNELQGGSSSVMRGAAPVAAPVNRRPAKDPEDVDKSTLEPSGVSTRVSFSVAARRRNSRVSNAYDESIYSYPADFRHQFKDRNEASSPETALSMTPMRTIDTPETIPTKKSTKRRSSKATVLKQLNASKSSIENNDSELETGVVKRLSFADQRARAKQWRDMAKNNREPQFQVSRVADSLSSSTYLVPASGSIAPGMSQKNKTPYIYCTVAIAIVIIVYGILIGTANDRSRHRVVLLSLTAPIRNTVLGAIDAAATSLVLAVQYLRAFGIAALAVVVVFPVTYGLFSMGAWFLSNSQRKRRLIEAISDEAKELLFVKYKGGPYPVVFLMESLMDKYRQGEKSNTISDTLGPGETLNRNAFRKLWPDIVKEVAADARITTIKRTFEGSVHECWRVIGGEGTVNSTHLSGDFSTDDFGHEDRHSTSSYTPANVQGKSFSLL